MASRVAVAKAMAVLGATFPRDVTKELVAIYAGALQDVDDAALERAVGQAVATLRYFPVPAELRDLAGANRVAIDVEPVLARIVAMGSYLPTSGTTYPSVQRVREVLGDGVAEAYSLAGGARVFSGNETTRDIARREFAEALRDAVRVYGKAVLAAVEQAKALPAPNGPVIYGERPKVEGPQRIGALLPGVTP